MGRIKRIDLFLLRYTLLLAVSLIFIWIAAIFFVVSSGFGTLFPANASELYLSENAHELKGKEEIKEDMFLSFNQYAVYEKSGNFLYGRIDNPQSLWNHYENQDFYLNEGWYLKAIERNEEVLLVSYPIKMMYKNDWTRNHLPNPEIMLIAFILIASILVVWIFVKRYAVRLSNAMEMIKESVQEIKLNNLDFKSEETEFKELNDINHSLNLMRDELKVSLEQSWEEQRKRELQVKALGHDIKTPLTIIKGNAELLTEMNVDPEIQSMLEEIIGSAQHLSEYAMSLTELDTKIGKEERIDVRKIFSALKREAQSLTSLDGKKLEWRDLLQEPIMLQCEKTRLKRAIMNLITNATERASEKIVVSIMHTTENTIEFSVVDDGHGFSEESKKRAREAFYTDDPSRHKKHQGLGLYSAQSVICDELGGQIHIENIISSQDNCILGASVTCQIPTQP